jgi:hypothetical protein
MQCGVDLTTFVGGVGESGGRCSVTKNGHSTATPGSFASFPLSRPVVQVVGETIEHLRTDVVLRNLPQSCSQLRRQNRVIAFGGQRTIDASDCCRVPFARQLILSSNRNYTMKVQYH